MIYKGAREAARKLRIKIHGMGGFSGTDPKHPENAKWLDQVSEDDAIIISGAFAPLVEAAQKAAIDRILSGDELDALRKALESLV